MGFSFAGFRGRLLTQRPEVCILLFTMADTNNPANSRPAHVAIPPDYRGNTPLMQQYFATRAQHPGIILLMRVGDFYEAYGDDAELIARDLNITLTGREDGGVRIAMAGV